MGRMIGDGGLVVNELLSVVDSYIPVGGCACVELMSSTGKEGFSEALGFKTLDAINGANGMQLRLQNKGESI